MQSGTNHGAEKTGPAGVRRAAGGVLSFLGWALVFGLAHTQAPLYYSNQHQYFLHGLAQAGRGFLGRDWLANTADPTPAFTALVAFTARRLHEYLFYIYYLLFLGLYFHALAGLFDFLTGGRATRLARLCFLTLVIAVHAALPRLASAHLFGVDYPWYFQAGVAGQYLLGPVFQPSVFGVLLVVSLPLFLRGRPGLAVTCAALAAVLHATYLLSAAFLTLAYLYVLCREGHVRRAVLLGAWALLLVSPVLAYNLLAFAPSSAADFAEAQRILVQVRIPHHALVQRWCDAVALGQVAWVVAALGLVRGGRLFPLLFLPFVLALVLTLVQVGTGSDALALLFPWRTSVFLVPVATSVILTGLVRQLAPWLGRRSPRQRHAVAAACGVALAALVLGGVAINCLRLGYRTNEEELPLLEYVRTHKAEGDVYLLPVDVPQLGAGPRGSVSTSFTPPPRRDKNDNLIAVDLQRFRLWTGAPIVVDFKSIPYKDVEVLDWHRRLLWAEQWYETNPAEVPEEFAEYHITHVVAPADHDLRCSALEAPEEVGAYRVYRVRRPAPTR